MSDTSKLRELQHGDVKIANEVVAIIANIAAAKIDGVVKLKGGIASDIADVFGVKQNHKGVKVNTEANTIELDLSVVVSYGSVIPQVARQIQEKVKESIESMTELEVQKIDVHVVGVSAADERQVAD